MSLATLLPLQVFLMNIKQDPTGGGCYRLDRVFVGTASGRTNLGAVGNAAECQRRCQLNTDCEYFVQRASGDCELHDGWTGGVQTEQTAVSGPKVCVQNCSSCHALGFSSAGLGRCSAGSEHNQEVDMAVLYLPGVAPPYTVDQCAQLCNSRPSCNGFVQPRNLSSGCEIYSNLVTTTQIPDTTETHPKPCFRKDVNVTDVTYHVIVGDMSWDNARQRCRNLGGDLATIPDIQHQRAAYETVWPRNLDRVWIGANDTTNNSVYRWIDGTSLDTYHNWQEDNPDHMSANPLEAESQDCVVMSGNRGGVIPGGWDDRSCQSMRVYTCAWAPGIGVGTSLRRMQNSISYHHCQYMVVRDAPIANGLNYDSSTRACIAIYGYQSVNPRQGNSNMITCHLTPPPNIGALCGIPTDTFAPTTGPPTAPPSPGPTPFYEHPDHQTNFQEVQSRLTQTEMNLAQLQNEYSSMQQLVSSVSDQITPVANEVSRIRSALVSAVGTDASRPRSCSTSPCRPQISATTIDVTIQAPLGKVGMVSEGCTVDDACTAVSFATALQQELRNI